MVALYLFNLLCAIVSCDKVYHAPEPKHVLDNSLNIFLKGFRLGREMDLENGNLTVPSNWGPPSPIVQCKSGTVEGYFMKVFSGRDIYAFEGIPYAEPPLGDNRFRAPIPKRPWSGIRQAKKPGHSCTQMHPFKLNRVVGNENCLFLNIYSPLIPFENQNPNLPVVIFVHGGSFSFGSGSEYGPAYLLQQDILLVTVNYRVGPLGFLSSGDEESLGNWGLKDQALAIEWVSENIEFFGGNASDITLVGQSAGAVGVHFQMMSNQSKHLFHRAISISGSAFNQWSVYTPHQARKWAEKLARFMRCPTSSSAKMMNCFRKRDANFLTANMHNLFDIMGFPSVIFRPVIEPDLPGAFLTLSPKQAYEQDQVAKIPFLVTNTRDEADYVFLLLKSFGIFQLWMRHWEQLAPTLLDYGRITGENASVITEAVGNFYFKGQPAKGIWKNSATEFAKIGTDRYFNSGNRQTLKHHSHIAPTYSYIFGLKNTKGQANMFGKLAVEEFGVSHADDLGFLFNSTLYSEAFDQKKDADMLQIVDLVVNLFSNFIIKGEPFYTGDDGQDHKIWEPIKDPENLMFLQIDKEIKMISDPVKSSIEFWESLNLNESYAYEYA